MIEVKRLVSQLQGYFIRKDEHLIPKTDNTYSIGVDGSTQRRWKDAHFAGTVYAANAEITGSTFISVDARIGGGLYVGGTGTDPDADDIHYDGNLKSVKSATAYDVYGFHPLTTPLTHTSFNGDSFSDAAATKIENTSWSSTIPADAKALLIRIAARDSGSSGETTIHFEVGPSNAQPDALGCRLAGLADDAIGEEQGVVPCTDGDIWYGVEASGASTLDCWLECWGYWI